MLNHAVDLAIQNYRSKPRQLFGLNPSADVENVDFFSIITVYIENILTLIQTSLKLITNQMYAADCKHTTKRERVQIINRWTNVSSLFNDRKQQRYDTHFSKNDKVLAVWFISKFLFHFSHLRCWKIIYELYQNIPT